MIAGKTRKALSRVHGTHAHVPRLLRQPRIETTIGSSRGFYTAGHTREMKDVPTMFVSGWLEYSLIRGNDPHLYGHGQDAKAAEDVCSVIGRMVSADEPAVHSNLGDSGTVKVNDLPSHGLITWLKRKSLERIGPEPVHIFRMGGGDGKRTTTADATLIDIAEAGKPLRLGRRRMERQRASSLTRTASLRARLQERNRVQSLCFRPGQPSPDDRRPLFQRSWLPTCPGSGLLSEDSGLS